jgi:cation diffusion facilitator CzcD-associated flavoprotein CzcO
MPVLDDAPTPTEPQAPAVGGPGGAAEHVDVAVVGTGFAGIAMGAALRRAGLRDFAILERADEVGGAWRDNSYPGCACDVPSHLYSLSFAPNPDWSATFSGQAEIHAYLRGVAEDHDLIRHVRFRSELQDATWDEPAGRWRLTTSGGRLTARVLISAQGGLSDPAIPDLPGLERFAGTTFHSATWDHDHDLAGERVAVIGTGASAIQFVPQIQPRVARLTLFQRTPPWIMPRNSRPVTGPEHAIYRRVPAAQRLMRDGIYWAREAFALPMLRVRLTPVVERLARRHLARQVPDPVLRAKLTPDYRPGCKRILVSNDYLPALGRPNVDVVDTGIREIREHSIVGADGVEHEVDTIIFGTGFRVTEPPIAERVHGRAGRTLSEQWDGSPTGHRNTTVEGFPNLFLLGGPGTGIGHTSQVFMIEAQVAYVGRALEHMRRTGAVSVEPRHDAQARWVDDSQRKMKGTVWLEGGCSSWYLDRQGRNTTLWPDFTFRFRRELSSFDATEYVVRTGVPAVA